MCVVQIGGYWTRLAMHPVFHKVPQSENAATETG